MGDYVEGDWSSQAEQPLKMLNISREGIRHFGPWLRAVR